MLLLFGCCCCCPCCCCCLVVDVGVAVVEELDIDCCRSLCLTVDRGWLFTYVCCFGGCL